MYEVKDGNKTIWFVHKQDADNYNDYLKNGLRIISHKNREWRFNNGDVVYQLFNRADYVLHHGLKTIYSERLMSKHLRLINQ